MLIENTHKNTLKIRWQKISLNKSVITINVSGLNLPIKDRDYEIFKRIKIQHQLCVRDTPKTMTRKYQKRNRYYRQIVTKENASTNANISKIEYNAKKDYQG